MNLEEAKAEIKRLQAQVERERLETRRPELAEDLKDQAGLIVHKLAPSGLRWSGIRLNALAQAAKQILNARDEDIDPWTGSITQPDVKTDPNPRPWRIRSGYVLVNGTRIDFRYDTEQVVVSTGNDHIAMSPREARIMAKTLNDVANQAEGQD